ncbi:hypothetical protein C2845_PM03G28140 [Panicum miliaceum]|uniref:tRNA/rRNA methyltransferase SpoU type domain-containing protein n=1 Tax=Panicum miliaceum TaxID=4540 RepID=A0A3L6TAR5_PANMI|nr:hypothetical protein C2845_PM03G28140 [Panicum miliaceum]
MQGTRSCPARRWSGRAVDNRSYVVCLVVEGLSDFGNVSAAFRSADALGVQSVHVISCDSSSGRCRGAPTAHPRARLQDVEFQSADTTCEPAQKLTTTASSETRCWRWEMKLTGGPYLRSVRSCGVEREREEEEGRGSDDISHPRADWTPACPTDVACHMRKYVRRDQIYSISKISNSVYIKASSQTPDDTESILEAVF